VHPTEYLSHREKCQLETAIWEDGSILSEDYATELEKRFLYFLSGLQTAFVGATSADVVDADEVVSDARKPFQPAWSRISRQGPWASGTPLPRLAAPIGCSDWLPRLAEWRAHIVCKL
jgi:hypothetical protein